MKQRIYSLMLVNNPDDRQGDFVDVTIITSIVVNTLCTFLLTFKELEQWHPLLTILETITMTLFIVEYMLRLWTCTVQYNTKYSRAIPKFLLSWDGVIGLLTLVPYLLPAILPKGLVAFRILRVFRILKLFKVSAYLDTFDVIFEVLKNKAGQLIASICLLGALIGASSVVMYTLENPVQPEVFDNALSGVWWAVNAIFTIGYGDIYPITNVGKLLACVIALLGVGLVAIPTGIISAGFVEQYNKVTKV